MSKSFGAVRAVQGLGFSVQHGSITALVGPNGAGKTTTLKLLLDLIRPDSGSLMVLGLDSGRGSLAIREQVGYLPESRAFSPALTVGATLRLFSGLAASWDLQLQRQLLSDFDLPSRRRVGELSRGMVSQLALLVALAPRPRLLLLDEPASGLDPLLRRQFMQSLLGQVADHGQTVLMSSHNLPEVERVADTVLMMESGTVVLQGEMERIKSTEKRVRVVFQGELPAAVARHPAVVSMTREGRAHLLTVSGAVDELLAEIQAHRPFALEVLDLSLQDIFLMHAGRGDRP